MFKKENPRNCLGAVKFIYNNYLRPKERLVFIVLSHGIRRNCFLILTSSVHLWALSYLETIEKHGTHSVVLSHLSSVEELSTLSFVTAIRPPVHHVAFITGYEVYIKDKIAWAYFQASNKILL